MNQEWQWSEADELAAEKAATRLPPEVFDIHAHLYRLEQLGGSVADFVQVGPREAGTPQWRESVGRLVGERRLRGGLFFPMPSSGGRVEEQNAFLLEQLRQNPSSRGLLLVDPQEGPGALLPLLEATQVVGFKPYHLLASGGKTFQARLDAYAPEWMWRLAHERALLIMLHLVRDGALRDAENQTDLRRLCSRYPGAKVVLAHAARGFHAPNTIEGLAALRGLDNVWYDSSGICEPAALRAILRECGPRRLLWGSDFPISERRGKCVTVGDGFAWINPDRVDSLAGAPEVHTLSVGLENLRALLEAADDCFLDGEDRAAIFGGNALRLLGSCGHADRAAAGVTGSAGPTDAGQELYRRAKRLIPGGVHLLSKRPEMFAPDQWPPYFSEARGCEVWDLDGRHYWDMSINGIGACLLGYRNPEVTRAVQRRVAYGPTSSLNPPEEVELAEMLCEVHPWARRVRLARTGGEVAAVAVRIARATTDRSAVAICGYHGWADWYLAANLGETDALRGHLLAGLDPLGVPRELRGTAFTFTYNNREELRRITTEHGKRLAAVIMEPCRSADPEPGFLEFVREEAHRVGALLIFDEITIGWRLVHGGSHLRFGVSPDLALFAKALGNGHPIAAVIGTEEAMQGAETSFISSSYWTEGVGPAAAVAALRAMRSTRVVEHVASVGASIQRTLRETAQRHGLPLQVTGYPCSPSFSFAHPQAQELKTLYTQLMLERGFLAGTLISVTLAHTEEIVKRFAAALDEVFALLAASLASGDVAGKLRGAAAHSGFRRLL